MTVPAQQAPAGSARPSLKDHILASLACLPNTERLHLVALSSTSKRTTALFPHTPVAPRCFQQDFFVVLGTEMGTGAVETTADGDNDKKLVLTSAISAHLYTLPHSAESILYISKVDSSSYPSYPSSGASTSSNVAAPTAAATAAPLPLTRTLITAFISYFLLPSTRPTPAVRVQLFARSQGQYLFPNSAGGKKGLGGGRLCGWWKGVYEDVVRVLLPQSADSIQSGQASVSIGAEGTPLVGPSALRSGSTMAPGDVHLGYLLPSYSAQEAAGMMGLPRRPLPKGLEWAYEPPFSTPIPEIGEGKPGSISLGDIIPSLEDDPKTRFLDEIASDTTRTSNQDERPGTDGQPGVDGILAQDDAGHLASAKEPRCTQTDDTDSAHGNGASHSRSPHPATTSLPPLGVGDTPVPPANPPASPIPAAPALAKTSTKSRSALEEEKLRRQAHASLALVSQSEFWERMGYRGECALDVTGFFTLQIRPAARSDDTQAAQTVRADPAAPVQRGQLPPAIVDRVHKSLLNTDFETLALALAGSEDWASSTRTLVHGEIGAEALEICFGAVEAKDPAVVAAAQAKRERKVETVTMLQPRKKKKV